MPRIGMNPSRHQLSGYTPARVTLAMLTYAPHQAGYFENRLAVTRLALESLIANTPEPFDVLVFDNGSCPEMVDFLRQLRDEGKIQFLILASQNIGKIAALQLIFRMAPGEVIAYADDDILFLPGWLEEHLKVLDTFPKVGMVTGFYIRSHMSYGIKSTLAFAEQPDVQTQRGSLIPKEDEQHYIDNMGRTWEKYLEEIKGCEDLALTYQGVEALVSAGHHQFVCYKAVLQQALPVELGNRLMGKMLELDEAVDGLGYLRLSTRRPVTRLLGNVISQENAAEARSLGLAVDAPRRGAAPAGAVTLATRFYRLPLVRRVAQGLYNRLFKIVNA